MESITNYFEQAQLSLAAYALDLQSGMFGENDTNYISALMGDGAGMSQSQAEAFAAEYTVVDQYTDPTGFSGTVFESDGLYYFAIRGSENFFTSDGAIDWFGTDFDEIGSEGIAVSQGLAMFNWVQRLFGEPGSVVIQYTYNVNGTISTFTDTADGLLYGQTAPMSVTGHSLGGHLSMMLARMAPDLFNAVYIYNAPGFDLVGADLTSAGFFEALNSAAVPLTGPVAADWKTDVTVGWNVEGDIVNLLGALPGSAGIIFSESTDQGSVDTHDIGAMVDALAVYALFAELSLSADPNDDMTVIGEILAASDNQTDRTLETAVNALGDLFNAGTTINSVAIHGSEAAVRDAFYQRILDIQASAAYQAAQQTAALVDLVSLTSLDSAQIAGHADTDIAYRYALVNLTPFVLTGDDTLYAPHNVSGELDLYDPVTGTGTLTEAYLDDRAAMLSWKLAFDSGAYDDNDFLPHTDKAYSEAWDSDSVAGDWRYTDYSTLINSEALSFLIDGNDTSTDADHQIKFGSDGDSMLDGGETTDQLYGGTGNDTLTGGQGADYLEGGEGNDTYLINTGDGYDTILDTDGQGVIAIDGLAIHGSADIASTDWLHINGTDTWTDRDNNITYTKSTLNGETQLLISAADNTVEVLGWAEGDLGIVLGEGAIVAPIIPAGYDNTGVVGLSGTQANNYLVGGPENDYVYGLNGPFDAGQDWLDGGAGNDYISGGLYDGVLGYHVDVDILIGGAGTDMVFGASCGDDLLFGDAYTTDFAAAIVAGDTQVGTGLPGDVLAAGQGNDILVGSVGNDALSGGFGFTNLSDPRYSADADLIIAGAGDDLIFGEGTLFGYPSSETWSTTDSFYVYYGNDDGSGYSGVLSGGFDLSIDAPKDAPDSGDVIYAGSGNDVVYAWNGPDFVSAGSGDDAVVGGAGNDVILGGEGNDWLEGDGVESAEPIFDYSATPFYLSLLCVPNALHGNDYIDGGVGNDILVGSGGSDVLIGGAGNDWLDGDDVAEKVPTEFHGDDVLFGGDGSDTLLGQSGNDTLDGGTGADYLYGGTGDDYYIVDAGDVIDDSEGNNTVSMASDFAAQSVVNGAGDLVFADSQGNTITLNGALFGATASIIMGNASSAISVQAAAAGITTSPVSLSGSSSNDTLYGTGGADTLYGNAGDDLLQGAGGKDNVYGGDGKDRLEGGNSADTLSGGAGNDTLEGGWSNDSLYGGDGNDTYIVNLSDDNDTVFDSVGNNRIEFGAGIAISSLYYTREADGYSIYYGDEGDSITVPVSWAASKNVLAFTDGSYLYSNELLVTPALLEVYGGNGDELIVELTSMAEISGGGGDDIIVGGAGDTVYYYDLSDGEDQILDLGGNDVIEFGEGISVNDVYFTHGYVDDFGAQFSIYTSSVISGSSRLRVVDGELGVIETFRFADGSEYSFAEMVARQGGLEIVPSTNFGQVIIYPYEPLVIGGDGNDTIYDMEGENAVYVGGKGDDLLTIHPSINYFYLFNHGDGNDQINAEWPTTETLVLGTGIALDSVTFTISTTSGVRDLLISYGNLGDTIEIDDGAGSKQIENYVFADSPAPIVIDFTGRSDGTYTLSELTYGIGSVGTASPKVYWDGSDLDDFFLSDVEIAWQNLPAAPRSEYVDGGAGNDFITTGAANDTLIGGIGADVMSGGDGDDTYDVDDAGDLVIELTSQGVDTVSSSISYTLASNVENLMLSGVDDVDATGNTLSNTLTGNDGVNVLSGDSGKDTLRGLSGNDTLYGDAGNDVLETGYGWDYAYGGEGNDTITGYDNASGEWTAEYLYGEDGDDLIQGGGKYAHLYGGAGNDDLRAGIGYQLLYGEDGDDILTAGAATYLLNGGSGVDLMIGGSNGNIYVVDNLGDVIIEAANSGTDTVKSSISYVLQEHLENLDLIGSAAISGAGNAVNNTLNGSVNTAANALLGGLGDDTYVVGVGDSVVEYANAGTDTVKAAFSYTLSDDVENLTLTSSANDTGTGNSLNNSLIGNNYNNTLSGAAGNDYLSGMFGNDVLDGGTGADQMVGSYGNDIYCVDNVADVLTELSSQGTDTVKSSISYTLTSNVEHLTLTGVEAINATGNTLSNTLTGNAGANVLSGAAGNDTLLGGMADDLLYGGTGNDSLTGGQGSDTYNFNRGEGVDTINDYDATDAAATGNDVANDMIMLAGDIAHDQLWFTRSGNDLLMQVIGTSDQIKIQGWYSGSAYQVEEISAGDGYLLMNEQVDQLVQAMAAFAPPAAGQMTLPESYRETLTPVIAANWQ